MYETKEALESERTHTQCCYVVVKQTFYMKHSKAETIETQHRENGKSSFLYSWRKKSSCLSHELSKCMSLLQTCVTSVGAGCYLSELRVKRITFSK